jgi:hypothetical protein
MSSPTCPRPALPVHPRINSLYAVVSLITSKLDSILVDGLRSSTPPAQHLTDHGPAVYDGYQYYTQILAADGPNDDMYV